jgi:hypothetical protein
MFGLIVQKTFSFHCSGDGKNTIHLLPSFFQHVQLLLH